MVSADPGGSTSDPRTLDLGDIAPGETKEGSWQVTSSVSGTLSNLVASFTAQDTSQAGVQMNGLPIKYQMTGIYSVDDLRQALQALEATINTKLDVDEIMIGGKMWELAYTATEAKIMEALQTYVDAIARIGQPVLDGRFVGAWKGTGGELDASSLAKVARDRRQQYSSGATSAADIICDLLQKEVDYANVWKGIIDTALKQPTPDQAEAVLQSIVDLDVPYYLITDYTLQDDIAKLGPSPDVNAVLDLYNKAAALWQNVQGTDSLETKLDENFSQIFAFLNGPLPAYYPVDALTEEVMQLSSDIRANGFGWAQSTEPTSPASWYAVGEAGALGSGWLPAFLQQWQVGGDANYAHLFDLLVSSQFDDYVQQSDLIVLKSLLVPADLALSWPRSRAASCPAWRRPSTTWPWTAPLSQLENAEIQGYDLMGQQMYNLLETQMDDASGMWRMSWDIMQNMQYLEENRLQDPPLPLFVESISTPDVVLAEGDVVGHQTAHVEVRNDSQFTAQVTPTLQFFCDGQDMGTFTADPVTIAAGATASIPVDYSALASSLVGIDGYDVLVYLDAVDPATMSISRTGPAYSHLYAGTAGELADYHQQTVTQPMGGAIEEGDVQRISFTADATTQVVRILLVQPDGANLDLHVYDAAGNHVGLMDGGGGDEIAIPGASYSGSDSSSEWIELTCAAGQTYQIEVHARLAPAGTSYTVAILQTPEYPARISLSTAELDRTTNLTEGPLESSIQVAECNGQHGITALAATAGDLVDGEGRTISAGQIQLDLADTSVLAGGSVSLNVTSPCPKARPTASIRARLRFTGKTPRPVLR